MAFSQPSFAECYDDEGGSELSHSSGLKPPQRKHEASQRRLRYLLSSFNAIVLLLAFCGLVSLAMTARGQRLISITHEFSHSSSCGTTSGPHKSDVYRPKTLITGVADCDCGSNINEARTLNCTYDALSAAWLPPWCRDDKLTSEFERAGPGIDGAWGYFADKQGKTELDQDEVAALADSAGAFWVSREWHIAHCLFYWRKYIRMRDTGVIMEARFDVESHVKHCAGLIQNPTPDHFFLLEVPVRLNSTKISSAGHSVSVKHPHRSMCTPFSCKGGG